MLDGTLKTQELTTLALATFDRLSESELKLLYAATTVHYAFCGPSASAVDPRNDPVQAVGWGDERTIRAALLRWLCVDRAAKDLVDPSGIQVHAARIADVLDLSFVTVPFPFGFGNCLFASDMNLRNAQLEALYLPGSRTAAVAADGLKVRGDLSFRNGNAEGEVGLTNADIGGNLDCSRGTFKNAGGFALSAAGIKVHGAVLLGEGFIAEGEVRLTNADIGGNLDCSRGTFKNVPPDPALSADGIKVHGNVFLRDGFSVDGEARLVGADITGNLECDGAQFAPDSFVNAEQASVTGSFFWQNIRWELESEREAEPDSPVRRGPSMRLNLAHTTVGPMGDDKNSWPSIGRLQLDGFVYARIGAGPADAKSRLEWLSRQERRFWPQPYRQLARVLREAGDDSGARRVLVAMENARRKYGNLSWRSWIWAWVLRPTIAYGYRPFRAGWWVAFFVFLGFFVFSWGQDAGVLIHTQDKENASVDEPFNGFVYSLETFLPLVDLRHAKHWLPAAGLYPVRSVDLLKPLSRYRIFKWLPHWEHQLGPNFGERLRWYFWGHILAGWFFTTMVIAGVTGLVRKD